MITPLRLLLESLGVLFFWGFLVLVFILFQKWNGRRLRKKYERQKDKEEFLKSGERKGGATNSTGYPLPVIQPSRIQIPAVIQDRHIEQDTERSLGRVDRSKRDIKKKKSTLRRRRVRGF